jgi:hypothetical protein
MPRGARCYPIPVFIREQGITQDDFGGWLDRVTRAHIKRDRVRLGVRIPAELYRRAIYEAVVQCDGRDYYTGHVLDWRQLRFISKGDGSDQNHWLLPTVDHENLDAEAPVFRICSMRTNKCKSDYSVEQLLEFCEAFIRHQRR